MLEKLQTQVSIVTENTVYWINRTVTQGYSQKCVAVYFCDSEDNVKNKITELKYDDTSVDTVYHRYKVSDYVLAAFRRYDCNVTVVSTAELAEKYYNSLSDKLQTEYHQYDIKGLIQLLFVQNGVVSEQAVMADLLGLKRCEKCLKWYSADEMLTKTGFCVDCDSLYARCPKCGRHVTISSLQPVKGIKTPLTATEKNRFGDAICNECINRLTDDYKRLSYYHRAPDDAPLFYNASKPNTPLSVESDGHNTRYFGVEFEFALSGETVDDWLDDRGFDYETEAVNDIAESVLESIATHGFNRHIYAEEDSSLKPYGVEFITNPMTIGFVKKTGIINTLFDTANSYGFEVNDTCGMHVHVNRQSLNKYSVAKMNVMLSELEYNSQSDYVISRISGRNNDDLREWSELIDFTGVRDVWNGSDSCYPYIYELMRQHGRYVALNSQNANTVEFRFFGATDDSQLVIDRLYFINALCSYANNHTLQECMNITINELAEWDNRINALFDRYL